MRKTLIVCDLGQLDLSHYGDDVYVVHAKYNNQPRLSDLKTSFKVLQLLEDYLVLNNIQNYWVECRTEKEIKFCSLFGFRKSFEKDGFTFMIKELF